MRRIVYLAGPVEKVDDAKSWREEVIEEFGNIEFINPIDKQFDPVEQRYEMFHWCLRAVQLSDFIIVNYIEGAETWGTPCEALWAWMNGVPVATWTITDIEDIPQFLVVLSDLIGDDIGNLIDEAYQFKRC